MEKIAIILFSSAITGLLALLALVCIAVMGGTGGYAIAGCIAGIAIYIIMRVGAVVLGRE